MLTNYNEKSHSEAYGGERILRVFAIGGFQE